MSDTPRTDAEAGYADGSGCWKRRDDGSEVPADFARNLERELAAARAELAEALEELMFREEASSIESERDQCQAEVDDLRAQLERAMRVVEAAKLWRWCANIEFSEETALAEAFDEWEEAGR